LPALKPSSPNATKWRVTRPPADAPDEIQFKAIDLELSRLEWETAQCERFLSIIFGDDADVHRGPKAGAA
jgi:hypothetical protein